MSEREGPMQAAQKLMRPELPKRFYKSVEAVGNNGNYFIHLDGRPVKTPARQALSVPSAELAELVAEEWRAQGERIDPLTMPLTRLVNVALDAVAVRRDEVIAEIVKYAGSDLLCYRAGGPEGLVAEQAAHWDPVLDWVRDALGVRLVMVEGVTFASQPEASLEAVRRSVADLDPLRLAATHTMMTLTGSAVLALAVLRGHLDIEAAWTAAHVDEDWNMRLWGADEEALERRRRRFEEMQAAVRIVRMPD